VAGVSYYKAAAPAEVVVDGPAPGPAQARLLEALYSEGLGEFAFRNGLDALPRPAFPVGSSAPATGAVAPSGLLVPVGGGKDSVVAIEVARRAGAAVTLFSVGDATPIARTAAVAGLPRLIATRRLDPRLVELNAAGALNGHVPVTAIVSCAALLTAAANGLAAVAMANERSASSGNLTHYGVDINHQFSKGLEAERLLRAALAEVRPDTDYFSLLRPASELGIARAFAALPAYHRAFTSCNAVFRLDPQLRATSWCGHCPKCRFVFLALAPFLDRAALTAIFDGRDLLDDPEQYDGIAALAAVGAHKPFECVGEEAESVAALRLLAEDPRWCDAAVVRRFAAEALPAVAPGFGLPDDVLRLAPEHCVPPSFGPALDAVLGAR
jgi:UDP-N-acetyl-alpha-D-muramoyl-L-alanyl-L-glutamate epimerase